MNNLMIYAPEVYTWSLPFSNIVRILQTSIWSRLNMTCSLQHKEFKCEVSVEYIGEMN